MVVHVYFTLKFCVFLTRVIEDERIIGAKSKLQCCERLEASLTELV